jgi:hypothetical protein
MNAWRATQPALWGRVVSPRALSGCRNAWLSWPVRERLLRQGPGLLLSRVVSPRFSSFCTNKLKLRGGSIHARNGVGLSLFVAFSYFRRFGCVLGCMRDTIARSLAVVNRLFLTRNPESQKGRKGEYPMSCSDHCLARSCLSPVPGTPRVALVRQMRALGL